MSCDPKTVILSRKEQKYFAVSCYVTERCHVNVRWSKTIALSSEEQKHLAVS